MGSLIVLPDLPGKFFQGQACSVALGQGDASTLYQLLPVILVILKEEPARLVTMVPQ